MKCCIYTLGCKVNQYESEALGLMLEEAGCVVEYGLALADYYILNTCAVTNEAEHKSREVVAKINKINPNAKIFVCGCSSQLHPDTFLSRNNVKFVCGTEAKEQIVDCINNENKIVSITPIDDANYNTNYKIKGERIRSYLKIQDGCNNFCSYCIIPYTRGRERSREPQAVFDEYRRLCLNSKEVVLVGINLSHYGSERNDGVKLANIIDGFNNFETVRIRISSLESDAITEDFMKVLKNSKGFCPSFHIPLQSGSDNVLKSMNRHYNFKEYSEAIALIRKYFPNASIGTDLIVGFPTESEEDFAEALENIKSIGFSSMHIFPFSKRGGTVADKMPQIDGTIVKERILRLKQLATKSRELYLNSQLGLIDEVLVEEMSDGEYVGFGKNYVKCYIDSKKAIVNEVVKVKYKEVYKLGLRGEVLDG
ncbi:MAG: tRNA (N(6)-L-threonylcarbamoyladenosine(37)-C(2))-methylthiotransferase MtaB [Clostridia bacterium]|nr:tRNA (N(6)-L-threonylcarbamoyladenosine(37)-C(2))-methylthiotransferase MtaB [Clostridia bacterium]